MRGAFFAGRVYLHLPRKRHVDGRKGVKWVSPFCGILFFGREVFIELLEPEFYDAADAELFGVNHCEGGADLDYEDREQQDDDGIDDAEESDDDSEAGGEE